MNFISDSQRKAMFARLSNVNMFSNRFALTQSDKDWIEPRMFWVDTARSRGERRVKKMKPAYTENVDRMLDEASDLYPNTVGVLKDNNVIISYDDNAGVLSGRTAAMLRGKLDNDPDVLFLHRDTTPLGVLHEIAHINEYKAREDKGLPIPDTSWNAEMVVKVIPNGREYGTKVNPVGLESTAIKFEERMKKRQARLKDKEWAVIDSEGNIKDNEFTEKDAKKYIYGSGIYDVFDKERGVWKKELPENVVRRMGLPSNELYIANVKDNPELFKHEDVVIDVMPYDL